MLENNQQPQNQPNSSNNRDECINVVVRIRGKGEDSGKCSLLNILDEKSIQVENKTFYYDYVANMNSTQEELFQHCAKRICDNSLNGYNGTIFAYGQTGSGKTYTMVGIQDIAINNIFQISTKLWHDTPFFSIIRR